MTAAAALAERVLAGDTRALARVISLIEDEDAVAAEVLTRVYASTGRAYIIGITGPPGAGKSTLVDRLIGDLRRAQLTVGVIAVDPSSPFTGGAVLGDRIRMNAHATDPGVFIRSMATRGHLGGLSRATGEAIQLLDAAGMDRILVETVGVGQDEVDIVRTADVSVVMLVPGTGDDVQALKAGIMEIADIFVVNKADREGADRLVSAIEANLSLHAYGPSDWRPPIVKTTASTGAGMSELGEALRAFQSHAQASDLARRRFRSAFRLRELLSQRVLQHLEQHVLAPGEFDAVVDRVAQRAVDPYTAVATLLARAFR